MCIFVANKNLKGMKTTKIYIEVPVAERLPDKEGRYIVSNGLGWFEVNYCKLFSFHEEFTDCSGVTHWLEPVEVPTDELQKLKINQK